MVEDADGTLTGFPTCGWVIPYYIHNLVAPHCVDRRWDFGGIICNCDVRVRKIKIHSLSPTNNVEIKIIRIDDGVDIATAPIQ